MKNRCVNLLFHLFAEILWLDGMLSDLLIDHADLTSLLPLNCDEGIGRTSYLSLLSLRASFEGIRHVRKSQYTIPSIMYFRESGH